MSHSLLQLDKIKTDFLLSFTPKSATPIVFSISIKYPSIHPLAELRSHPSEILLKNIYYPNPSIYHQDYCSNLFWPFYFYSNLQLPSFSIYKSYMQFLTQSSSMAFILKSKHDFPTGPASHSPAITHQTPATLASSLSKHAFRHLYLLFALDFYMLDSCLSFRS